MDAPNHQQGSHHGQGSDPTFSHIPYDQRWEPLKPIIIRLYMEEGEKIAHVAERMKSEYGFSARLLLLIRPYDNTN